ncbi:hypothetical protein BSKO_12378 [Bryopsis sp. KO-2023]|nr:hypothetical protein BSKO_12378 [Bryopsis sp. KO-2023]
MAEALGWMPETHKEELVGELKTTVAKKESNTVALRSPTSAPVYDPFSGGEVWMECDATVEKLRAYVEGPLNAVLVGATMTGKSTFVNEVLGLELKDARVGNGLTSCTSACQTYSKNLRDPDLKLNLTDTPGLFDSGGAKVDEENVDTIGRFLKQNHPDCVLLFLKFYDSADGKFTRACKLAASIAKVYQCNILVVHTFCDPPKASAKESSFPTKWLETKLRERKEIGGTFNRAQLWEAWKTEKGCVTVDNLGKLGIKKNRIFQCRSCFSKVYESMKNIGETDVVQYDGRSQYELPDGTKMIPKILEEVSDAMGPRALRLIRECCINEEARIGADYFLGRHIQLVLGPMGIVGECLSVLIEKVCNAVTRKNARQAEVDARVEELHERLGYDDTNSATKKALYDLLQSPITAVMVGKTMSGKSTFANKVLGSGILREGELPEVGGGMVSCTSKCKKYEASVEGVEFPLEIIDTPGLFDSCKPDRVVQGAIMNFLGKQPPKMVFLFLKFGDPMDGAFEKTCGFAAQIAKKFNCSILAVHTLCDQSFDFPTSWVEEKKEAYHLEGTVELEGMLWSSWAAEKADKLIQQCSDLGIGCDNIFQCHCSFPPRTDLDIILMGGDEAEEHYGGDNNSPPHEVAAAQIVVDEKTGASTSDGYQKVPLSEGRFSREGGKSVGDAGRPESSNLCGAVDKEGACSNDLGRADAHPTQQDGLNGEPGTDPKTSSNQRNERKKARIDSSDMVERSTGGGGSNQGRSIDRETVLDSDLGEGAVKVKDRRGSGRSEEAGLSNPNEEGILRPNVSEEETVSNIVSQLNRAMLKSIRLTLKQAEKGATQRRNIFGFIKSIFHLQA